MEEGGCKAVFTASCNVEMQYANNYYNFYDINVYVHVHGEKRHYYNIIYCTHTQTNWNI